MLADEVCIGLFVMKRGAGADGGFIEKPEASGLAAVQGQRVRRLQVRPQGSAADVVMLGLPDFRVRQAREVAGEIELVV